VSLQNTSIKITAYPLALQDITHLLILTSALAVNTHAKHALTLPLPAYLAYKATSSLQTHHV
jgi:hypothetical protein